MFSAGSFACAHGGRAVSRSLPRGSLSTLHRCLPAMVATQRYFRCMMEDKEGFTGNLSLPCVRSFVPAGQTRTVHGSSWICSTRSLNIDPKFWSKCVGIEVSGFVTAQVMPGIKLDFPVLKMVNYYPLLSMVACGLGYGVGFGWDYSVAMISHFAIHEMGHALMIRHLGVPVDSMLFVPFGALVKMPHHPENATHEIAVLLAGPILGTAAAFVPFAFGIATGSQLACTLAHLGFTINLLSLLPFGSTDGGQIAAALNKWLIPVGFAGVLCVGAIVQNPVITVIMLHGIQSSVRRLSNVSGFPKTFPKFQRPDGYFDIPPESKKIICATYCGLVGALIVAMKINNGFRVHDEDPSLRRWLDVFHRVI
eukprot:GEMP01032234.1.p1 GENE.GEMP01032234.1~~GEMP01032234.1.p1  ORF type:complete len:366 (+),score=42.87 GEMP01032234.1:116-1213(+)